MQENKEDNPFNNNFSGMNFEEDMTPVEDSDMPFN